MDRQKCDPFVIGVILNVLIAIGMTLTLKKDAWSVPIALWIGTALSVYMLHSLCAAGNQTAAWLTVLFSPVVIVLFATQMQIIIRMYTGFTKFDPNYKRIDDAAPTVLPSPVT